MKGYLMEQKELLELGLSEELASKVINLYDTSIKDKFVPRHRLNEEATKVETLQAEIATRDEQLKGLEKLSSTNTELSAELEKIRLENKEQMDKMEADKAKLMKTNALTEYFASDKLEFKPVDKNDILDKIDLDKVTLAEDGSVGGIDEQYKTLTESKPHWFTKVGVEGGKKPPRFIGFNPQDGAEQRFEPDTQAKIAADMASFMHGVKSE